MPYLLDADWAIRALTGHPQTTATLEGLISTEGVAISWVTVGELYEGPFGSADPKRELASIRRFIRSFRILNLNDPIIERFAELRATLRRRGELIPDFDLLLGATALHYDLTVFTSNLRHLGRIPGIRLYRPG